MSQSNRVVVDWRVVVTAACAAVVAFGMLILEMEPRLVMIGFVAVAVGAAVWLVIDLAADVTPLWWTDLGTDDSSGSGSDRRVHALRSRLRAAPPRRTQSTPSGAAATADDDIADTLVAIVDDHLIAEFGIDRSLDTAAASEILGPELQALIGDPSVRRAMTSRRRVQRTIGLIEDFCDRSRTTPRSPA